MRFMKHQHQGHGKSLWYSDYSTFPDGDYPFFVRGGHLWDGAVAGLFCFNRSKGDSVHNNGFRAVLV